MLIRSITTHTNLWVTAELLIKSREGAINPFKKLITLPLVANNLGEIDLTPLVKSAFDHLQTRPNSEISLIVKQISVKND